MQRFISNIWTNIKYKKQFRNWVASYVLVVLAIVLVTIIGQGITASILRREVVKANSSLVAQVQLLCDGYLKDMEVATRRLINTSAVRTIYNRYFDSKTDKGVYYTTVMTEAKMVMESNKMLSEVYVVFRDRDLCISNDSVFDKQILQEAYFGSYFNSVEECMNTIFDTNARQFKLLQDGQGKTKFLFIYTFISAASYVENDKPVAVVFEIDPSKLLGVLQEGTDGQFILLDQEDNVIYADKGQIGYYESITGTQPQTEFRFEKVDYIANYLPSTQFGGKYVHVIPKTVYAKSITRSYRIIVIICFLCLLFGVLLSLFFASYHYVPMKKLLDKIKLDQVEAKKREKQISEMYLANYLLGQQDYDKQQFENHSIRLERDYFALAVFNITEFGLDDDAQHEMTMFSIENIFSELMHDSAATYYCVAGGFFVCLINFNSKALEEIDIHEKAIFTNEFLNRHMGINFVSAISTITDDAAMLPKLYQQCVEILAHKFIFHETAAVNSEDVDDRCIKIKNYIEQNYSDGNLSVKAIADEFQMSFNYISKYFKEHTGEGMAKYIIDIRIEKAKELLLDTHDTVAKIAGKTGFYSSNVFIRTFKKVVGVTPGQYREQNKSF